MNSESKILEDETLDGPCGLKIIQKKKGYRYSQDSLQLVEFADVKSGDDVIDFGTGSGIMALILAKKGLGKKIVGLEVQRELAELARRNVELNGYRGKIEIIEDDIKKAKTIFPPHSFDYVLSNPPYVAVKSGLASSGSQKAVARHEILCNMNDVLEAMRYSLKPLKRGACVYPAARFAELILEAKKKGLEPKRVQFVYSAPEEKAELVMVEFVKSGKPGVEILPPLINS